MAPSINKKYAKICAVGLAATALVVGLSVGLVRNKAKIQAGVSSANAYDAGAIGGGYDRDSMKICSRSTSSGKSGKSGGGKSGRRLVVPGTEDYAAGMAAYVGKRNELRNKHVKEQYGHTNASSTSYYPTYSSDKSGKSGGSSKSGKSGDGGVTSTDQSEVCILRENICSYSYTSEDSFSGKSGKSGGGKSGGISSYSNSSKSGKSRSSKSGGGKSGYGCGKSGKSGGGKSGGGKSGKSGVSSSYSYSSKMGHSGKSGKSGHSTSYDDYCPSVAPFVCESCACEDGDFYYVQGDETCVRSCALNESCDEGGADSPAYCGRSFKDVSMCCDASDGYHDCIRKADDCGECLCEEQRLYFVEDEGACFRSCEVGRACDVDISLQPDYCGSNGSFDIVECCRDGTNDDAGRDTCLAASRDCGDPFPRALTDPPQLAPAETQSAQTEAPCVCKDGKFYYVGENTCKRSCEHTRACCLASLMAYCFHEFDDMSSCCQAEASDEDECMRMSDDCGECLCEEQRFYFLEDEGACFRSCDIGRACNVEVSLQPDYCSSNGSFDIVECCRGRTNNNAGRDACLAASRDCGDPLPPAPTDPPKPAPTDPPRLAPADPQSAQTDPPCVCEDGKFYYLGEDTCERSCERTRTCRPASLMAYCPDEFEDISSCCHAEANDEDECMRKSDDCGECVCEAQLFHYFQEPNACGRSCDIARACDEAALAYPDRDVGLEVVGFWKVSNIVTAIGVAGIEVEGAELGSHCGNGVHDISTCCLQFSDNPPGCLWASFNCGEVMSVGTSPPSEAFPSTQGPTMRNTPRVSAEITGPPAEAFLPTMSPKTKGATTVPSEARGHPAELFLPTTAPEMGGSTTVSIEATGPPAKAFRPTMSPTMGGTTTVSTETTGTPTKSDREVL